MGSAPAWFKGQSGIQALRIIHGTANERCNGCVSTYVSTPANSLYVICRGVIGSSKVRFPQYTAESSPKNNKLEIPFPLFKRETTNNTTL